MIHEFSTLVNIPVCDLLGRSRKRETALHRAVYWWLLHGAGYSYSEISRLNDRTPPAVLSAVRMIENALSVGDRELAGIVDKVKHLKYKYMSQVNRSVHITAPSKVYDLQKETFVFDNIKCEYCNGSGGTVINERSFNYDPAKGEGFVPCTVCKGAKRVKATVRVVWEPDI